MKSHMIRKMSEVIQKQRNQSLNIQKQSFKGVLMKRYSEICSRTPMPKCDFHVDAKSNFIDITLLHGCSLVNLLHIFITVSRGLQLNIVTNKR